jgi:hypothetical protein
MAATKRLTNNTTPAKDDNRQQVKFEENIPGDFRGLTQTKRLIPEQLYRRIVYSAFNNNQKNQKSQLLDCN